MLHKNASDDRSILYLICDMILRKYIICFLSVKFLYYANLYKYLCNCKMKVFSLIKKNYNIFAD